MSGNVDGTLVSDDLLQRAEKMLRRRLETDATDSAGLVALAMIFRKQGRLREAADAYEQLATSDHGDGAAER